MDMSSDPLDAGVAGPAAVRGGAIRIVGYAAGVLITLGSAIVLFRHLGVVDAGRYVLVLSIVTLAAGVTDAGLASIGVRELVLRHADERDRFMRSLIGLRIVLTVLASAAACGYAALAGLGGTLVLATGLAALGVLTQNLQSTYSTALMAQMRFGWVTGIDVGRQGATAVFIVALAIAGAELLPFLAVAPAAGALAVGVTAWRVRGSIPLAPSFDVATARKLLAQTLPFALAATVYALYFRLAVLMVDLLSDERQTGLFGASFRIVEVIVIVPQLMVSTALPIFARAARDDRERLTYGLSLVVRVALITGVAVGGALAIAAPVVIDIVAGSDFAGADTVLRWHALALVFAFASATWGYALLSVRAHGAVLVSSLSGLVVLVLALVLLTPDHGAEGAAAAMVIGEATLAAVGLWLTRRAGLELRPGGLVRLALAAALAAVPGLLLGPLAGTAAAAAVFGAVLLLTRAVPRELIEGIRR